MAKDKPPQPPAAAFPPGAVTPADPSIATLTYEQAVEELEDIIDRIESGDIGLEDSIKAYERGIALRAHCDAILSRAEQKIADLTPEFDADRARPSPPAGR